MSRKLSSARAAGFVAAASAAFVVLATGLTAFAWPGPAHDREVVQRIVSVTRGDLSDEALQAVASQLDPAARALARRHDPGLAPAMWGAVEGWSNLSISGRPNLGFNPLDPEEAQRINAAIPSLAAAITAAKPFAIDFRSPARKPAVRCLALAIYYEAALEPRAGQEAVAQVVLNRVRDPNFPNTVCGVVFQGADLSTGCQFSFTCLGDMARPPAAWAWKNAEDVAEKALNGYVAPQVGTATFYHADYVMPYWSPNLTKLNQIGRHIFYRWRGRAGEAGAFTQRYRGAEPFIDEARYRRPRVVPELQLVKANSVTITAEDGEGTRVITTLGGRRKPTKDDIARINASLGAYEQAMPGAPPKAPPRPAPTGVTTMDVTEIGKPAPKAPVADPAGKP